MVKSLDEVIERLQYKADNIKAKLEPSYFTECIDYLKSLPRVQEEQEIRNKAIDEFAERIPLEISESIIWGMIVDSHNDNDTSDRIIDYVIDTVKEIAEQMKGE